MEGKGGYLVPAGGCRTEETIRRSRFITTLERAETADDARAFVDRMRLEFADATHNCWAFVAGPPGSTTHIGSSDDGEPSGTAGRPILQVLLHGDVGEVAAVVTRYYGGTKLGTGGLARAYSSGVKLALESMGTEVKVLRVPVEIEFGYSEVDALHRLAVEYGVLVGDESYTDRVLCRCAVPQERLSDFESAFADLTRGTGRINRL